ncbi:MAG TPA: 30S ribosomal protein S20 [Oscillospiraceae bacterium]|nr:30S ribosomal protein S20 [Oscillospiraceae bacterium]HNW04324.1 30S ribosomal protein S20 [Oscillospiraceae bacterium]
MPNIKSAKKRVRITAVKAERNKAIRTNLKTNIKKAELACSNAAENREEAVRLATKRVDQACAKGVLHKNTAARRKSALARKLNASS